MRIDTHAHAFPGMDHLTRNLPASPELFGGHFAEYPDVRVCLAHMNRDDPAAAWAIMKQHANLGIEV